MVQMKAKLAENHFYLTIVYMVFNEAQNSAEWIEMHSLRAHRNYI